ncbi:hypothetical protein ABZ734_14295 [Streptomyces sp. NPDC006660]|uniref:hypothetical protein n=1 Tax=Streptomyces sp. NPDC006660 TaxID=3156901 RepID=UPI0033C5BAF3
MPRKYTPPWLCSRSPVPPEPVPEPGCEACVAASVVRARAHMAGDADGVARATRRIRLHPHEHDDER